MSEQLNDRLYNLLPAIYRNSDAKKGEPLKALLRAIEREVSSLEEDIDDLYNDWFIETCAPWVIPYIGDLLGIQNLHPTSKYWSLRSYVANTIAYRRRKGTNIVLEQISRDVTGWPAHSVEFFERISTTQKLGYLRLENLQSPDFGRSEELDLLGGPFDRTPHTIDIRNDTTNGLKYNISGLVIFLWRLRSYIMIRVNARKMENGYCFDPTGKDIQLFNRPRLGNDWDGNPGELDFPSPIRRSILRDKLERLRESIANSKTDVDEFFDFPSILHISLVNNSKREDISPEEIIVCDLKDWDAPITPEKKYINSIGQERIFRIKAALDPERGRIVLLDHDWKQSSQEVIVDYCYGFSGDIGAGPYDRSAFIRQSIDRHVDWQAGVIHEEGDHKFEDKPDRRIFRTIASAVAEWNKLPKGKMGIIAIMDNRSYNESVEIKVPEGSRLMIVAADWLASRQYAIEPQLQKNINVAARMRRPHIIGDVKVKGTADQESPEPGELLIDGLLIEGNLKIQAGFLGALNVSHCTFIPVDYGIAVESEGNETNSTLELEVRQCICGPIRLCRSVPRLRIIESILDHPGSEAALYAEGSFVFIDRSTIFGKTVTLCLEATNSIFNDIINAIRVQKGWIRYCYSPFYSRTPIRYYCQPDTALKEYEIKIQECIPFQEKEMILSRVKPNFSSIHYGDQGYAQLSQACCDEIKTGAEDGSELGVFSSLQNWRREDCLQRELMQYLPSRLQAEIFYVT